jgi:hypothetical protein
MYEKTLLVRSVLSACEADLANLLREVQQVLDVPNSWDHLQRATLLFLAVEKALFPVDPIF